MTERDQDRVGDAEMRRRALSRWEAEGGASSDGLESPTAAHAGDKPPRMAEAELVTLHVRVIALENLVIALLANATEQQRVLAREMAAYISPRPGFTQHPITTRAAHDMIDLLERAERFRTDD